MLDKVQKKKKVMSVKFNPIIQQAACAFTFSTQTEQSAMEAIYPFVLYLREMSVDFKKPLLYAFL